MRQATWLPPTATARRLAIVVVALATAGCGASGVLAGLKAPVTAQSSEQNRQAAEAELHVLLPSARLPAGASPIATSPIAVLDQPPQTDASPNLIVLTRWWRIDEPIDDVFAWIHAHPPHGLAATSSGSSGGPGVPDNAFLGFSSAGTVEYFDPTLLIGLASLSIQSTAIRVDAQVVWLPAKPADELVPPGSDVDFLVQNHFGSPSVQTLSHKHLDAKDRNVLIDDLNALPVSPGGVRHCAADTGYRVLIGVRVDGAAEVVDDFTACAIVLVSRDGSALPTLSESSTFASEIQKLAGPPPSA